MSEDLVKRFEDIWYLMEPGALDHCIQLLIAKGASAKLQDLEVVKASWWALD